MNRDPRVVIADPDSDTRERIAGLVRSSAERLEIAVSLHQAGDGGTAFAVCSDQRPALVISEILLPNLSGLALLRRLRAEHMDDTVVIFVTELDRDTDRYWGLRNGAKAYITKPFDDATLSKPVEDALRRYCEDLERPIG